MPLTLWVILHNGEYTGADPGILERGAPPPHANAEAAEKCKSECQISVFLASVTEIQGLIVT